MTGRARRGEGLSAVGKRAAAVCLALAGLGLACDAAAQVRDPYGVAVIVGNRDYEERGLSNVDYAVRDAQAFERYVLDVLGFDPDNVLVLENATRGRMFEAFGHPGDPPDGPSDLWARLDTEGRSDVSVFYSGHGVPGLDDGKGYLLPVDVPARFAQKDGYPIAALYERLAALRSAGGRSAKSARVYLDACFSGQSPGGSVFVGASPVFPTAALPEAVADGVAVLSAGGVDQLASWDDDAGHGMFTHHLLDALYGRGDADGDGRVTAVEAKKYLDRHMTLAAWLQHRVKQTANLSMAPSSVSVVLSMAPPGGFPARPVLASGPPEEAPPPVSALPPVPDPEGAERAPPPPPDPDPPHAEAEKSLGLSREDRILVQRGLESAGGSVGSADGIFGPRTRAALQAWQEKRGLTSTGYLMRDQAEALIALGRDAARAAAARAGDAAWEHARSSDTASAYADYDAALERERSRAVDDAAWERAHSSDTASGYADYLSAYPSGRHVSEARRLRDAALRGPAVGDVFRDCDHCPAMVVVPSGSFMMGSPPSEEGRDDDEGPVHRVSIPSVFAVGVYEVTFEEWDACVSDGVCYPSRDEGWGRGQRPAINVGWPKVQEYVRWLSRETGKAYRLLSESEWEYVARAGTTTRYHWGDAIGRNLANCDGCGSRWDGESTSPVGVFGANSFGLHDVHGNVAEWVEGCNLDSYAGAPNDGTPNTDGSIWCGTRVVRGGSWDNNPWDLRAANRDGAAFYYFYDYVGFRVARTFTP